VFLRLSDGHLKRKRKITWDGDQDREKKWTTATASQRRNGLRFGHNQL
jgi:hypothetical protein